ncbi:MAG: DUF481 domain-containing protein [Candidatus Eiseniibacteriota bacterium]
MPTRRSSEAPHLRPSNILPGALRVLLVGVVLAIPGRSTAQIVNTLSGFDGDGTRWSGQIGATFSVSGGNTEVRKLGGHVRVQWLEGRHRVRLLGEATRESAAGERTAERSMAHLRHNLRLAPWLSTLTFSQIQRNPFQDLRTRLLVGAGFRFDLLDREAVTLAMGAAHMVELEETESGDGFATVQRLSLFVAHHLELPSGASLDAQSFVQPLWSRPADLRATGALALGARFVGPLHLVQVAKIEYDAEPPEGVETTDWELETAFALRF